MVDPVPENISGQKHQFWWAPVKQSVCFSSYSDGLSYNPTEVCIFSVKIVAEKTENKI